MAGSRRRRERCPSPARNVIDPMSTEATAQRPSCERCRGQKLRCIWQTNESVCQRCRKAKSTCVVPQPKPMGRPPRKTQKIGDGSRTEDLHHWDEMSPIISPGDPALTMPLAPLDTVPDPFQFYDWFPGVDFFNDLTATDILRATNTATPALSFDGDINTPSSVHRDPATTASLERNYRSSDGATATHIDEATPYTGGQNVAPTANEQDQRVHTLTKLCELNIALLQHPLSTMKIIQDPKQLQTTQRDVDSVEENEASSTASPIEEISVSQLGIGKLLGLSFQLKQIIRPARSSCNGVAYEPFPKHDRSSALMALSCYIRLEAVCSYAVDVLRLIRGEKLRLLDPQRLMPGLAIDGFALDWRHDIQIDYVLMLLEKMHYRLKTCIGNGGKLLIMDS